MLIATVHYPVHFGVADIHVHNTETPNTPPRSLFNVTTADQGILKAVLAFSDEIKTPIWFLHHDGFKQFSPL